MLVVDGQRTFVIGLYENPAEDAVLDEVARAGFNLVRASEDLSVLDRLHSRGLFAWINTGGRIELNDNPEERKGQLEDLVTRWGSHPALLVWEVPDEALWNCMLSALQRPGPLLERVRIFNDKAAALSAGMLAGYKVLKQLDPNHPVWMNHAAGNSVQHLAAFGQAADIIGCDIYPLMPYPTHPLDISRSTLAFVGLCTARMGVTAPGKPVWMVLQGMSWGDFNGIFTRKPVPGQRPTFEESRFMAYDAIVRGSRGVLSWGTHYVEKDSPFWKDLMKLARELADRQPLLTAPDAPISPKVDGRVFGFFPLNAKSLMGVQALGKVVDGQVWWIVVNEFPASVSYTLSGLEELEGLAYTETTTGRSVAIKGGVLAGAIPRYGVHVLRPVLASRN
jgi:hypothetical protein